jgi:hypothetical protein
MDLTKGKENHKLSYIAPVAQVDRAPNLFMPLIFLSEFTGKY